MLAVSRTAEKLESLKAAFPTQIDILPADLSLDETHQHIADYYKDKKLSGMFVNAGGPPDDDALSDGITDQIIAVLSRVEGLRVASRTSAFALKGSSLDAPAIGQRLHVGSLLEGSVRRAGDRLRVAVQLVSAQDGCVLWGERYDRDVADVFAIQDEIAESVARALRVILRHERRVARPPTGDVHAYECYLKGRQYFREGRRRRLQFARAMFQRAIAIDPQFARAWAGVSDGCSRRRASTSPGR